MNELEVQVEILSEHVARLEGCEHSSYIHSYAVGHLNPNGLTICTSKIATPI